MNSENNETPCYVRTFFDHAKSSLKFLIKKKTYWLHILVEAIIIRFRMK